MKKELSEREICVNGVGYLMKEELLFIMNHDSGGIISIIFTEEMRKNIC